MFSVSLGRSFKISCSSWNQQATLCHVCFQDFLPLEDHKPLLTENYTTLNEGKVLMQQITNLGDPASTVFL